MIANRYAPSFLLLGGALSGAMAQTPAPSPSTSSLTVFGIVDQAVRHVKNDGAGSVTSVISGGNLTSRIGLRGTEALGNGLSAGFWLEGGLSADTGASVIGTQFWDRAAYINLKSTSLGELRIGHDLTTVYIVWGVADPFNQVGIGSVISLYPAAGSSAPNPIREAFNTNDRNATTTGRSNNTITYFTPNTLGGFNASVSFGPGEGATGTPTATTSQKYQAVTAGYVKGPVSVRAGYAVTNTSAVPDEKFKDLAWHAIYDFGVAKASIAQRQYRFRAARENILQLGLWVPVGGRGTVKAGFGRLDNRGSVGATAIGGLDVRSYAIGYQHDLSKRTVLYATGILLDNDAGSSVPLSGGSTVGYAAGRKAKGFEAGIRHSF